MNLKQNYLSKNIFLYLLVFLFLSASSLNFFKKENINSDLVFCPLQKTWVKRNEESQSIRQNPLNQICMNDAEKNSLAIEISLKNALAIDEKGIFETLQKGFQVLDNYPDFPNLPQQNLAVIKHSLSVLSSKDDTNIAFFIKKEVFSFALNSRPPTVQKANKFDFQTTKTLDQISRNINPRSPPFSI